MEACSRVGARLKATSHGVWWLTSLLGFALVLRLAAMPLPDSLDAAEVWRFARRLVEGVPYDEEMWDHRLARFGMVGVVYGTQLFFGDDPRLYYLPQTLMVLLQVLFAYQIALRLGGARVAFWACLTFLLLPLNLQFAAGQLKPSGFSAAYILGCLFFLVKAHEASGTGRRYILLAAAAYFLAYASKISNAFFGPGILIAIWLLTRRWSSLLLFSGVTATLVACEILLFRTFTDQHFGRISIILNNHLASNTMSESLDSFLDLFQRFTHMPMSMLAVFGAFALSAGYALKTWSRQSPILLGTIAMAASFLILMIFGFRSVDPIRLLQPVRNRYLLVAVPLLGLVIFAVVAQSRTYKRLHAALVRPHWWYIGVAALILVGQGFLTYARGLTNHPLVALPRYRAQTSQALEAGTPIISRDHGKNAMRITSALLLDSYRPEDILVAKVWVKHRRRMWFMVNKNVINVRKSAKHRARLPRRWLGKTVIEVSAKPYEFRRGKLRKLTKPEPAGRGYDI